MLYAGSETGEKKVNRLHGTRVLQGAMAGAYIGVGAALKVMMTVGIN
jgi:formate/nitrite transporter FocA (FNT family)